MDAFQELNRAAFSNYDPDGDMYDPEVDNYAAPKPRMGGIGGAAGTRVQTSPARRHEAQKTPDAQFDITITHAQAGALNIELFNAQNTIAEFMNGTSNPGLLPALSARVIKVRNSANTGAEDLTVYGIGYNEVTGAGTQITAYWNEAGDLIYTDAAGDACTISCKQIPYRSLVKYSERGSFRINKMRMKFSQSDQINQDIQWKEKTFLGATKSNTISVSSFFRPDQFQSLLIDVPTPIRIDAEKGLFYTMAPGSGGSNVLLINMFIGNYTRSAM